MIQIDSPVGTHIAGYSAQHDIVSIAATVTHAKKFRTVREAARFIQNYTDAGYGLTSAQKPRIVPV